MTPMPDLDVLLPDDETVRARRDALAGELAPRPPHRRFRVRRIALGVAALLAAGTAAAAATGLFSADDVDVKAGIGCYSHATLDASVAILGARPDPVATCARLWRRGHVGQGVHVAPPLVACTGRGQPVRVFPSSDPALCGRLDLVPLPDDYARAGTAALRASWTLRHLAKQIPQAATPCPSPRTQAALARTWLRDMRVTIAGDGPCASGFDVRHGDLVVTTVSRQRAAENHLMRRINAALGALDAVREPCVAPADTAALARRRLDRAGLTDVRVTIEGDKPCTGGGRGTDPENRVVTIVSASR